MIQSDFYPTIITYGTMEITSSVTNLNLTDIDVDPCRAYYMGQLKSSDVYMITPKKLKVTVDDVDPDKTSIKLEETNAPVYWGYAYADTDMEVRRSYWDPAQLKYRGSLQFFNSLVAYYVNNYGNISVSFNYWEFAPGETPTSYGYTNTRAVVTASVGHQFTCEEFIDFIENDTPVTLTFTIGGTPTDFEIKFSDFDNSGFCSVTSQNQAFVTVSAIQPQGNSFYYGSGSSTPRSVVPFVSTSLTDKYYAIGAFKFSGTFNQTRVYFYMNSTDDIEIRDTWTGYDDTHRMQPDDEIVSIQLRNFDLTLGDLRSAIDGTNSYRILVGTPNSYCIIYSTTTTGNRRSIGIENTLNLRDYYTLFCLVNKYRSSGQDSTSSSAANNAVYYDYTSGGIEYYSTVALFNTDNSPKSERASYDGDYPNFQKQLRDWQKYGYNITDDEFNPDQPTPPGGDDDPGSDDPVDTPLMTGDDQDLQTDRTMTAANDFITLYNITPPMLSIFGRTLWKSIADYDPQDPTSADIFKNFFAILNEEVTGTLDIGAILQFVVSVRQYPFNVAGMGITTSAGDSIKIGTGIYPISLGSGANVQKLTSTIGLIDCGSVTIADYKDFKLYNDFRDYLNATVTAFLPYCGSVELNPIEVIHNTVHCYYAIDFYTGECTAYITTTDGNHTVLSAIKNGSIGVLVPITATNSGQISARHMSDNAKDAGLIVSNLGNLFGAVANAAQGNIAGFGSSILGIAQNSLTQKQMQAERQGRSAVLAPSLSGGSGAAAFYQPSCPSIVVRRGTYARQKINNYPQTCAYPSTTSGTLKSFHGYTECYNVNVSGLNCTEEERAAVKSILESGCYLP